MCVLDVIVTYSSPDSFFFYCSGDPRDLHSFPTRRSSDLPARLPDVRVHQDRRVQADHVGPEVDVVTPPHTLHVVLQLDTRSEEHTSELQSHSDLVCRLLLEKKKQPDRHDGQGK